MTFWDKLKEDLKLGVEEGKAALISGAEKVKEKASELSDEGRKRYKIFSLKNLVKDEMAELGARVYALVLENPDFTPDAFVNTNVAKIKKLEAEIKELEAAKLTK